MDQARLFIAIGLSILVFLLWDFFFVKKEPVENKQSIESEQKIEKQPREEIVANQIESIVKKPLLSSQKKVSENIRNIIIDTPIYSATISEKGAVIKSFSLKNYRESVQKDSPFLEMVSEEIENGTVRTMFLKNKAMEMENAVYKAETKSENLEIYDIPQTIKFVWVSPQNIVVEKEYTFDPHGYKIELNINIKNLSDQPLQDRLMITLVKDAPESSRRYGFEGPSGLVNGKLEQIKFKKIEKGEVYQGQVEWIAVQGRYFFTSLVPPQDLSSEMKPSAIKDGIYKNSIIQDEVIIMPGTYKNFRYGLFLGPKQGDILKNAGSNLEKIINYGWFDKIAKPCVWLMNFIFNKLVGNYGIAIIILTILTKILLWPLGTKSYKSMNQMKKLQPLMKELREKYKDDRQRMNQETMALYKTYKVNPLGGCLPMVVQIPVFFALYRMLYEAIELRHAPFFGWINDLSAPDRLFQFDFAIPLMQAPYGIPVLTIIMGATMLISQKMQPPMGDPMQAKMMMMMPIVFTVIFINFSSGLVLYWLTNNILSILQQQYTAKKYA